MLPDKETYHLETIYKLNDGLKNFVYPYLCSMRVFITWPLVNKRSIKLQHIRYEKFIAWVIS